MFSRIFLNLQVFRQSRPIGPSCYCLKNHIFVVDRRSQKFWLLAKTTESFCSFLYSQEKQAGK